MKQACILIVDDEPDIRELIAMYLRKHEFKTVHAGDGSSALEQFRLHSPDLILLDVIMPGMDGIALCQSIRKRSTVPIIFLTSRWESKDIVQGLEAGGDDYVTKPFRPDELVARVKSTLRRVRYHELTDVIEMGKLTINRSTYEARYEQTQVPLLAKEIKLLLFLAERPRQVFSVEQLYDSVWEGAEGDARTVMVHISTLRRKLEQYAPNAVRIETVKGIGYRLNP